MIIVKKTGYLKYKDFEWRCTLGKAGIKKKKKEGDNITPRGIFKVVKIYYRADKIKKITSPIKVIQIKKNMGWCDDPNSIFYNQQINLPSKFSYEKLYRSDNLYDIIIVLGYNINPIIKNKGSAIFIHVAKNYFKKTKGCIALKKKHLVELISLIKKNTKIKIG
jgi:hypothetical protein